MHIINLLVSTLASALLAACTHTPMPPSQHLNRYYESESSIARANAVCEMLPELAGLPPDQRRALCKERYNPQGEYANRCVSHYLNYRVALLAAEKNSGGKVRYPGLSTALNSPANTYLPKYSIHHDDPKTGINLASELHIDVRPACVLRQRPKLLPTDTKAFSALTSVEKMRWKPFDHRTDYSNLDLTP